MKTFRFITTTGQSPYYKTWKTKESKSVIRLLEFLWDELVRIYDADICGDTKLYVRVKDMDNPEVEEFWVIKYSWYIEHEPEWELVDEYEFEKIDFDSIPEYYRTEYLVGDRDWMRV